MVAPTGLVAVGPDRLVAAIVSFVRPGEPNLGPGAPGPRSALPAAPTLLWGRPPDGRAGAEGFGPRLLMDDNDRALGVRGHVFAH